MLLKELQAAYAADPWFADADNVKELRYKGGLYFYETNRVCVAADNQLKMRLLREAHDPR